MTDKTIYTNDKHDKYFQILRSNQIVHLNKLIKLLNSIYILFGIIGLLFWILLFVAIMFIKMAG